MSHSTPRATRSRNFTLLALAAIAGLAACSQASPKTSSPTIGATLPGMTTSDLGDDNYWEETDANGQRWQSSRFPNIFQRTLRAFVGGQPGRVCGGKDQNACENKPHCDGKLILVQLRPPVNYWYVCRDKLAGAPTAAIMPGFAPSPIALAAITAGHEFFSEMDGTFTDLGTTAAASTPICCTVGGLCMRHDSVPSCNVDNGEEYVYSPSLPPMPTQWTEHVFAEPAPTTPPTTTSTATPLPPPPPPPDAPPANGDAW